MAKHSLEEILARARRKLDDFELPFYWEDVELTSYLNDFLNEICEETWILQDSLTDGTTTRTDISFASTTKRIATVAGNFVTDGFYEEQTIAVVSALNTGAKTVASVDPKGKYMVTTESLTTEATGGTVSIISNWSPCRMTIVDGTADYLMDPRILSIDKDSVRTTLSDVPLVQVTRNMLDCTTPGWRTEAESHPYKFLLDYSEGYMTLSPTPDENCTLSMTVFRKPLVEMSISDVEAFPELPDQFHLELADGICWAGLEKLDTETIDVKMMALFSAKAERVKTKVKRYCTHKRLPGGWTLTYHPGAF